MNLKESGRKVYLNEWLEVLYFNIDRNIKINEEIFEKTENEFYQSCVERDKNLKEKLDTYKKFDGDEIYYYFFPRELVDIMWILLENNCSKGSSK